MENRTTEQESNHKDLENMSTEEILLNINKEDATIAKNVYKNIGKISLLCDLIVEKMKLGGRLFYIGAGTSGRLGIVDASELPPTFGLEFDRAIGIIAGGDRAIRKAVEFAEDDVEQGWKDLLHFSINKKDIVIGIAASGSTPYVLGGLIKSKQNGISTGCIVCNTESRIAEAVDFPIEIITGPEFVTGSTRMKAGTAQKLVLNMISTTVMIKLGKIKGNKMVDMQLSNNKLVDRGVKMVMKELNLEEEEADLLLKKYGNVRDVLNSQQK